ncbi:glycosyltransferase [Brevibacterium renqingii]|uniref:glycosyltransferase n=1 Tax=Brevibacterium renqingii TaxID=2776916 RepID=UPI001FE61C97|nr:glycosyltransferase [Brevibacterium renqingii]
MRISMISEHASPLAPLGSVDAGGQNVHVDKLAAELTARGHDVTVFTRRDSPEPADVVVMDSGTRVVHISTGEDSHVPKDELLDHMPSLGRGIAEYWHSYAEARPDVVHSHFWMSALAGRAALESAHLPDVPLVHTYHALGTVKRRYQGSADTSPGGRIRLERTIGEDAARIISTCEDEKGELARMGIDTSKVDVVPCGVDLGEFTPGDGPTDPPRIVCLGRLVPRKGIDLVIRGLAKLHRAGRTDVVLDVIGGSADGGEFAADPEVRRLRDLAAELGVEEHVRLRGHMDRSDIPAAVRGASVVACTPWYEPFGIVPLEAMACGVPVIAAAVGGLQNTVVDGTTGLLIPPGDSGAFAAAAERVLSSPDFARSLGAAGIERARQGYTWARVAEATEASYELARGEQETGCDELFASRSRSTAPAGGDVLEAQLSGVECAVDSLREQLPTMRRWSEALAQTLAAGGTLFCAGNGGSAAEAQHLSAELVGRFSGERPAYSSIALSTDSSAVTAISNDYGFDSVFSRQIEAHAKPGDILILLSTSGRSPNLVRAAEAANRIGATTWALTGPGTSPLTKVCDSSVRIDAAAPHVQEAHLMAVHCLCAAFDDNVGRLATALPEPAPGITPARPSSPPLTGLRPTAAVGARL